ncbi:hypothetical protein [Acinetobacter schindleri]|uniref:Uncharacterized protein n=1 Tax=Acinetobacter schindleri CIP 107287 TaxID=1217988 RepID=N9ALR9_9GAMM|nr:hypothetical protein [Acinetobacter schindleri]ENV44983.1 hypothetical protein F955_01066 [Acinetobacter schindleri CIP 107287]
MILNGKHSIFKKSCLASMVSLLCMPSTYALQQLSDESLADTTGEGIALTLNDFKMVFQAPNDVSAGSSYTRDIDNPGQADTGFIRIIPTGENYTQLGQRAYDRVYADTYNKSVLQGKADQNYSMLYKNTYDTTYNSQYSTLLTSYSANIETDAEAKRETFLLDTREALFKTPIIQQYYTQRLADYRNGTWGWDGIYKDGPGLATDGTTKHSLSSVSLDPTGILGYEKKAKEYALGNTYEMINLLYGPGALTANSDLTNSTFYKSLTNFVRSDQITVTVNSLISNEITRERLAAELRAKYNATQLAEDAADAATQQILALIIAAAEASALQAAANSPVKSLKTKADVFIYGLALSKSDGSLSTRYSNQGFNWGTASNPWLFRAGTENVRQFKDKAENLGYLALEAPLAKTALEDPANIENTSFNIKLGFWSDIFSRELNSSREVNPITGAPISGLDKEYRLRTQFIANGLSLNGSQVLMFQTLESDNKNYNQTFGMASLLRLNTNDNPADLSIRQTDLDRKGIRIGTATLDDLDSEVATPAMKRGSLAPIFHNTEGLYLYSPNINLVLGNMYQPFIVGSEGNNIILEVTRIPKVASIYNQIYQNYGDGLGTSDLKGSTCNVNSCGTAIDIKRTSYQGRNATHSSIAIGTTERLSNNMLRAKDGADATGVVFKGVDGSIKNLGSVAIDGVLIQHLKIRTTGL